MIKQGYQPGARRLTALVLLYEKCDKMALARRVFDDLIVRDDNLWNRLARGYVKNGMGVEGLKFYHMSREGYTRSNLSSLPCLMPVRACRLWRMGNRYMVK